jgi:hypothetical protein
MRFDISIIKNMGAAFNTGKSIQRGRRTSGGARFGECADPSASRNAAGSQEETETEPPRPMRHWASITNHEATLQLSAKVAKHLLKRGFQIVFEKT